MGEFKDHFSTGSGDYARYRPGYPAGLFETLAALSPDRSLAWDVATGSGQSAIALAAHFDHVVATDASGEQVAAAERHPRVEYRVEPAEHSTLTAGSVSAVTVAQALHWFDFDAFFAEVKRVARKGAIVAAWTYGLGRVHLPGDPDEYTRVLGRFYLETVGPYWPPERRFVEQGYSNVLFPFEPVTLPPFAMEADWDLHDLLGYLGTWSAVKRYREALGKDPVADVAPEFARMWGPPAEKRRIEWPLKFLIGRV